MPNFSTSTCPPRESRDAWVSRLVASCGPITPEFTDAPFDAAIEARAVGGIEVIQQSHNARQVSRSRRQILAKEPDCLLLILQCAGTSVMWQNNMEACLLPGDLTLIDARQPHVFRFTGPTRQLSAHVPLAAVSARVKLPRFTCARRIVGPSGIGAVAGPLLAGAFREAGALAKNAPGVREALIELVASLAGSEEVAENGQHRRVQLFIEARLADPDLTPARIAAAQGISVRHLHRVFHAAGETVCDWMRAQRLERCRRDLLDPRHAKLTVTEIAFRWGFGDTAHFSRAFKTQYGMCPRDVRAATLN